MWILIGLAAVVVALALVVGVAGALDHKFGHGTSALVFILGLGTIVVNAYGVEAVLKLAGVIAMFMAIVVPVELVMQRLRDQRAEKERAALNAKHQKAAEAARAAKEAIDQAEKDELQRAADARRAARTAFPRLWTDWQVFSRPGWDPWPGVHVDRLRPYDRIVVTGEGEPDVWLVDPARVRLHERTDPDLIKARRDAALSWRQERVDARRNREAAAQLHRDAHAAKRAEQLRRARAKRIATREAAVTINLSDMKSSEL